MTDPAQSSLSESKPSSTSVWLKNFSQTFGSRMVSSVSSKLPGFRFLAWHLEEHQPHSSLLTVKKKGFYW